MDPISDFFIQIKNAYSARRERVLIPFSKMKFDIARVLQQSGFIDDVDKRKKKKKMSPGHLYIQIRLKYDQNKPALERVKLFSKPSRRLYVKAKELKSLRTGQGMMIMSTPKGILSADEAKKQNVGGELIAYVG